VTIHEITTNLLEKHHQMNCLMDVTKLINNNSASNLLFDKYFEFLRNILGIEKACLYIPRADRWFGIVNESTDVLRELFDSQDTQDIKQQKLISLPSLVEGFQSMVVVFHKENPIAYALFSDIKKDTSEDRSNFVITLINIIAVAIENKFLFKQQLDQEKYKKELELASEVQQMLIPKSLPTNNKFDASSIYKPQQSVGGDYFDFIILDEDRFLMCIADISGKGVAAALMMSNFQASLRSMYKRVSSLKELVELLNESVYHLTFGEKILSFFVAVFNLKTRKLNYVNAGHNPPLLVLKDKTIEPLSTGTTLLGVFDKLPPVEEGVFDIGTQEAVLITYTDGLTDLSNYKGEYFPEQRAINIILENFDECASVINKKIMKEIEDFALDIEYPDDIAILTCKIK